MKRFFANSICFLFIASPSFTLFLLLTIQLSASFCNMYLFAGLPPKRVCSSSNSLSLSSQIFLNYYFSSKSSSLGVGRSYSKLQYYVYYIPKLLQPFGQLSWVQTHPPYHSLLRNPICSFAATYLSFQSFLLAVWSLSQIPHYLRQSVYSLSSEQLSSSAGSSPSTWHASS